MTDGTSQNGGNAPSDFRYDTGDTRVPWDAVGERFSAEDTIELVRFLLRPDSAQESEYHRAFADVEDAIRTLGASSVRAPKLTMGDRVSEAEAGLREFFGVKHACLLANWTGGMEIAYKLSGLQPGHEVIVPSITFIASVAYPLSRGAKVVFADIDPRTVNLDPADVIRKITPRTRVIMPVHMGGCPVDMDPIMDAAREHDIYVIEDAAHGQGAKYKGRYLGAIGHFGGFSLHEVKNINSLGEGGILLSDLDLGEQFARARFLGLDFSCRIENWLYDITPLRDRFERVQVPGNHSVTEIQAVALMLQMARLEPIIARRRCVAQYLNSRLQTEAGIITPIEDTDDTYSTHHLYLLQIEPEIVGGDIQLLKQKLKDRGVTEIQHFGPLYKFQLLKALGYDETAIARTCPVTEEAFNRRYTHLPLYGLSEEAVEYMADAVIESVREMKQGR